MVFIKGQEAWNKDIPMGELTKEKLRTSLKGRIAWNKGKKLHYPVWNKDIPWSEEIKQKLRKKRPETGKKMIGNKNGLGKRSEETKGNISKGRLLRKQRLGYINSPETRKRMSENCWSKGKFGKDHPSWKENKSYEPYSVDWTQDLKRAIRKRDKYICQICGKEPAICVHHIDYDKKNCNLDNLITLCGSCHSSTNRNHIKWAQFLQEKVQRL